MAMTAPVKMICARCHVVIPAGSPIERFGVNGVKYIHIACGSGRVPKEPETKIERVNGKAIAVPVDPKVMDAALKGWTTEEVMTPGEITKRLYGQGAPAGHDAGTQDSQEVDYEEDNPDEKGNAKGGSSEGGEQPEGDGSELSQDQDNDGNFDGEGSDEEGETDADGQEEDGADGDEDGEKSPESRDKGKDHKTHKPKNQQSGEKEKLPAETKQKTGKLEDLPDELLLRLAMIASQMAEERVKKGIESRLSKILAEVSEPLTAKMASDFQSKMAASVKDQLTKAVHDTQADTGKLVSSLRKEVDRQIAEEIRRLDGMKAVIHRVERPDGSKIEFPESELFHFAFDEVLKLAGAGFDVFTPGPTGAGKTHMFNQVSQALGLRFALVSGTGGVTESELFGTAYPNITTGENVYQATEFVEVYEGGGLFLLDEADAMDPNCLLKVNSAIANGYCTIPKRLSKPRAVRHKDFVFALAANTWGHGATRMYCGRNKLDEATLDRFRGGTVPMDYDPAIERRLVEDQGLYRTLAGWRAKITQHGLPRVLSTRFMVQARKLKSIGYTDSMIAKKLTGGWTPGEVEKVMDKIAG